MPFKLIGFILFIVIIFAFIGFNLDNHTDINLWVNEQGRFEDVSIIIIVFGAYLFGLLSTVPFWFARSVSRSKAKKKAKAKTEVLPMADANDGESPKKEKKKLLPGKNKKSKNGDA